MRRSLQERNNPKITRWFSNIEVGQLLTKEMTAVYLGISMPTLNRLIKEGSLNPIRFGRSVRFSYEILEDFKRAHTLTPSTA